VGPLDWVRREGIVLESARGRLPNLAEFVAGEPITGSRWSHPASHNIYAAIQQVRDSPVVVATRLVNGKVTLIHRRLWPALARLADRLPPERLAAIHEEHTPAGAHGKKETPFHDWLPPEVSVAAGRLTDKDALKVLPADLLR
jgi:hypothetical protein